MKRRIVLALLLSCAGCGDTSTRPGPILPEPGLFVEPLSFCLPFAEASDTLFIHNLGDSTIEWRPLHVPPASIRLDRQLSIEESTIVALVWTWVPPGPFPVIDSLVVQTTDPGRTEVVIRIRVESPDYVDDDPPAAPAPGLPREGALFQPGGLIEMLWTRVSDCSGIVRYHVQIAADQDFRTILLDDSTGVSSATIRIARGNADRGLAFWRIRARDGSPPGLVGPWSEVRSWTVE